MPGDRVPQAFLNQLQELKDAVMFATKTQHKPCPKCHLEHPVGQCTRSDNQKIRNDHIAPLLHRMVASEDKKQRLQLGHDMVAAAIKGAQNSYKSKAKGSPRTKYGKDTPEKVGAAAKDGKVGERERASPEVLKTCREQKLCITFAMTGKCERADCTWEHRRLEGKKVAFKGAGVSMMNFLTNVTNEARHETGAGPVVEVPVGTVMRFPFASHFCIPEFLIGEEMREISGIEIPDFDEIELDELDRARREAELRELRPLELGPAAAGVGSWIHHGLLFRTALGTL